ncbi:hypothetical protein [Demequina capsici]|uniref:Uncharacterized protein n=1 Tax=Demequina capsici TaxID=3075620 RepID=A0AA96JA37_9MICO|nr:hypothetical protein [Demequina sp. OYTSA14]WNM24196.1 hypothetical protein RN606_12645 [Demequina sp. OYTSA14]
MTPQHRVPRRTRAVSVASEAWRNLTSGTSRPLSVVLLLVVVLGGVACADIRTIVGLSQDALAYRESGAAVEVFAAEGAVSGQRCDALGSLPGVMGAGATRQADLQATFLTAPRAGIVTIEATPGLAGVLGIDEVAGAGEWLSDQAVDTLGADAGTVVPTDQGSVMIAATYAYPDDAGDRTLAYAAISPVPADGDFDACWVLTWPPSQTIDALVRATYSGDPADAGSSSFGQLNTRLGATFDGVELFEGRATATAPILAALFGLVLGALVVWVRRLEIAGALHARVSKAALISQILLELVVLTVASIVILLPATYVLAVQGNPDPWWPAWIAGFRAVLTGSVAVLMGAVLTAATMSERRLFRYFKDR